MAVAAAGESAEYKPYTDEEKIAGVIIHRADKLRTNFLLQHPLVRVHIIDSETGQHLNKQDKYVCTFSDVCICSDVCSDVCSDACSDACSDECRDE
mgnify:CR=1 FL=1